MDTVQWAARKARDLAGLERELVQARELPRRERARLAIERYAALARNSRQVRYLGRPFHYDGRLMPALLPAYLSEIRRLDSLVGLARATVVDIGANVGQFAATIERRFPGARIWSFEPNPTIIDLLARNAAGSTRWTVVPWGVGEQDGEIGLWAVAGKSGQGSVFAANAVAGLREPNAVEHRVQVRRLTRERLREWGIPEVVDVVKIDVEGAEASALAGIADLRWRHLAIETSLGRDGGLDVAATCELVESIWGQRPAVVWQDSPVAGAATVDAVLALPG